MSIYMNMPHKSRLDFKVESFLKSLKSHNDLLLQTINTIDAKYKDSEIMSDMIEVLDRARTISSTTDSMLYYCKDQLKTIEMTSKEPLDKQLLSAEDTYRYIMPDINKIDLYKKEVKGCVDTEIQDITFKRVLTLVPLAYSIKKGTEYIRVLFYNPKASKGISIYEITPQPILCDGWLVVDDDLLIGILPKCINFINMEDRDDDKVVIDIVNMYFKTQDWSEFISI